ncbi:sulfate transporter N-terminal domain with GLY motif-domain-containing protein [Mycena sp. CBHHK59/15]|nr:sulfate transporter N-terminal domain with GLY motif-domain-containing protein [Mycena sp. CBHHK59/15]
MAQRAHLNRPLDPSSSAASTSSLMDIDGVAVGEASTLIDVEHGQYQYGATQDPDQGGWKVLQANKYYVPGIAWIPTTHCPCDLGGDFLAGITVASMLIPQSVSYASSLAQLSPLTGLFSASIPGIIYAFLGTCRQLNVAPEAAISLLVGQAIAISTIITLQVGPFTLDCFSFLLGFFRLGFIDVVLSRALLRGFITAIAVVIMIEQLVPMFGLTTLMHAFLFLVEHVFPSANVTTTIVSFSALAVLVALRIFKGMFQKQWWIYRLPEVLVVVVLSTCTYFLLSSASSDAPQFCATIVVQIPLRPSNLKYLRRTTSTSVLICVVGFLDSIPEPRIVALGASNLAASFIPGTLPAWGSITSRGINGDVGGRTQMASLVCSGVVLLATFFLLPWLYFLPKCVLSAM